MTYATRHIETQDDVGCYLERQFLKVNLYFKHVQHQMCALKSNVIFPEPSERAKAFWSTLSNADSS